MTMDESFLANSYYHKLCADLAEAYRGARKHKRGTDDELRFELHSDENVLYLAEDILRRSYKPSRGIAFVTTRPVIREIFAAPFRDRVVHHLIYNYTYSWWDRHFIYDSYSCRENKGTDFAVRRLYYYMRKVSRSFAQETYVVKCDIQGYFMSLPHRRLYERALWGLDRQFPKESFEYNTMKYLWREIIFDDPTVGIRLRGAIKNWDRLPDSKSLFTQTPDRGIVIGNLTSQLLSNIYLDQLDRYVTQTLGYKAYGRYVDDFYFVLPREKLEHFMKKDLPRVKNFIESIGLTLHPHKTYIQNIERGVPFLGVRLYPYRVLPDKRMVRNFREVVHKFAAGKGGSYEAIVSYLGRFQHMDSQKILAKIFAEVGWDYVYDRRFGPSSLYYTDPKLWERWRFK